MTRRIFHFRPGKSGRKKTFRLFQPGSLARSGLGNLGSFSQLAVTLWSGGALLTWCRMLKESLKNYLERDLITVAAISPPGGHAETRLQT